MSFKNTRKIAVGALLATLVGYIVGILTAPKSGKDTRKELADSASLSKRDLEKKLKETHIELKKNIKEANIRFETTKTEVKKELESAIKVAKKAEIKVKETLSALHEGTADNPDLTIALDEANRALSHFKKYLKK